MKKSWLFLITIFLAFSPVFCFAENYNLEKIFYLPKYNCVDGVASLTKNWDKIDILAPQYHNVLSDFSVVGKFGPKLTALIKEHNLKVMPLVANSEFSQKVIHSLLTSKIGQDKVVSSLIKQAKDNNYIGWQFDFEHISYLDKDLFTAFVQKTYTALKKENLILSVVAVARTNDDVSTYAYKNWGGAYDYENISKSSDFVTLMAYDDPNSVGPTASLPYVQNVLNYAKDKIPAEKLSLGLPLYYWKWDTKTNQKNGVGQYNNVERIMSFYNYTKGFDEKLGVGWLDYFFKNKEYKIWFEDAQSFQKKINLVKNNKLRGFSAWLIGGEDSKIWDLFSQTTHPLK
jgi:spore germination protein YaaH